MSYLSLVPNTLINYPLNINSQIPEEGSRGREVERFNYRVKQTEPHS
jgi:hypothetical protein